MYIIYVWTHFSLLATLIGLPFFPLQVDQFLMAEALISVVLEQLASITRQQVQQQVKLVVDVKKEVANLRDNFRAIKAVLKDAEERQVKEDSVKLWLDNIRDVSNEMEDVLDDWNTEILKLQIEKQEKEDGNALDTTKKKVCLCIPTAFFCSGQVTRFISRRDIAQKIKDLNERLAKIANMRQNFNFQYPKSGTELIERQKTTSFVDQTFGRVDEKELLVDMLLSESNPEGQSPIVIPIVGMGGIGKTTLSQLAYNDKRVQENFKDRIWVCVSDPFDELNIAKTILARLGGNVNSISSDLDAFFECLQKSIEGKKFLLVLDDVWNQDYMKWANLKLHLQKGVVGSKIIVTTRKEEVATMMGAPDNTINLKVLSDENCWSLFAGIAFTNRNQDECQILEPIGREIVKKCKGLPLVAKTLGGLMRCKKAKKEWQDVLSSEIWELDTMEQQVFQPLLLSYYDLTPMIQRCLLYCVTFPKDLLIKKKVLIELWMSQGFLGSVENKKKTIIDVGESYFDNLVMRSFFQNFKQDKFGDIKQCQMHNIVHDFLQYLTKNECLIVEVKGGEKRIELPADNKLGHLTITFAPKGPFPVSLDHCQRLRTITTFDCKITSLSRELILQLKCVRTLNLSDNLIEEVPDEVGVLVHLRYLDLSDNWRLKKLPDSLCNLVNLQTLRVDECHGLKKLPEAMGKLTSLQHLHAKIGRWPPLKLPKSIARLKSLRTLDLDVIIGDEEGEGEGEGEGSRDEEGFRLSDLRDMDELQGKLRIELVGKLKDSAASDAEKAKLVNKKHLLHLGLGFPCESESEGNQSTIEEAVLNALQPNSNLESLWIEGYDGSTLYPNWTSSLINLKSLTFSRCNVCNHVPLSVLGYLGSLETLTFQHMEKVKKVGFEYSLDHQVILFPNLKQLEFSFMGEWEECDDDENDATSSSPTCFMPRLSTLSIEYCFKLKTLPDFLPRKTPLLQNLIINGCFILSESCKDRQGPEWSKISHIPNIAIDGKIVQKDGVWIIQEEESDEEIDSN
ncbi:putative disease resistance protein RGA3 [Rosa rugosa]|uniref:putative disease resistance protein RGA3 n=1 Tax=Rosa rugosa TaxID=74645 RepID=UPI002B405737|nr:putative disease resistance protein RGA3 [Rosa rugosa]XP_062007967.1 putative disease resistance protein RGA3 [Rosa rugosa]XP_062007968.1 putative disease resistance protein RGA3 [Rosa rugosa]XP_062007969.1 putative disease resistance protein RGA3 [Rosa rugosa]XP_062007970.1 putative disease resistance protein RGA3 [Rosa rugosa]XP_062007971.1 putative disease resistance protein RGA3 [Rosa rugosa]XP_062007972.1 putative disease resistance protein RGA3 [Rosa rugosa]XP_062007973.1 putative d